MKNAAGKAKSKITERKTSGPYYAPAKPLDVLVRQEEADEVFVMPVRNTQEHYFVINGIAADLWCSFDGSTTIKEHTDRLIRENKDVAPARIKKDVTKFLASLKKLGLVD